MTTGATTRGNINSKRDILVCTVCGYYRFAHLDGRITANPAQYVRRPKLQPSEGGWTVASWHGSCSLPNSTTTPTPALRYCSA